MTAETLAPPEREPGHAGHFVQVGDVDIHFEGLWDWDDEQLTAVLVWTHDLPDAEAWWRARAYLEGPGSEPRDLPDECGLDDWLKSWPAVDADLSHRLRRVWARWVRVTGDDTELLEGLFEVGDLHYVESAVPAAGFAPVTVVGLPQ